MEPAWWAAAAVYGALQALEIILIVFGAILLMNHLEGSGAVETIRRHFSQITEDRRVQVLLIGLGFVTLIEGAAGFGTPGALAAPLMVGLGFPALAAAVFGLMFNAPQPPFGAAGTPVIGGIGAVIDEGVLGSGVTLPTFLDEVTAWTALVTGTALVFWGLFGVFLLLFWFGRDEERSLRGAIGGRCRSRRSRCCSVPSPAPSRGASHGSSAPSFPTSLPGLSCSASASCWRGAACSCPARSGTFQDVRPGPSTGRAGADRTSTTKPRRAERTDRNGGCRCSSPGRPT
jgi:hypothetical protein